MTIQEVLEINHAVFLKKDHWVIKGKGKLQKEWEIHIYKNTVNPEWGWKIDTQYCSEKIAAKYLIRLINEKKTGIRIIEHKIGSVPVICGINGAACRLPNQCNSALCRDCPVAEKFFAERDGVKLHYIESIGGDL